MNLYYKSEKNALTVETTTCDVIFHPTVWGFGIVGGKEWIGFGLENHYESALRITFLCWSLELVHEVFIDEDGLVGNDRSII